MEEKNERKIKKALISVYHKEGLDTIVSKLNALDIEIVSTGGTEEYINKLGYSCTPVEELTNYPSIFGGRVKTLHPSIMGGILARRNNAEDDKQCAMYQIPHIDLVIVDIYPFVETMKSGAEHQAIIEKIDIGGISLIRAAAKNYADVVLCPSLGHYKMVEEILDRGGITTEQERRFLAAEGFRISSMYDAAIASYLSREAGESATALRYGENPHQKASFEGDIDAFFTKHNGKELSYNNLLDVDAAVGIMEEFDSKPTFAILKHNNPCGLATGENVKEAYLRALSCDPLSAFGGILITNREIDLTAAEEIGKLFFEVIIAPKYSEEALDILKEKKNRIILERKEDSSLQDNLARSCLNGTLIQERNRSTQTEADCKSVTEKQPTETEIRDMLFANKIVKHCKSNAIVLAKNGLLLAAGVGQTSRIDALKQAIEKAERFGFSLQGAVLASDAFFPFNDCVEEAHKAGITAIIQPGGSVRDEDSIVACNNFGMAMCFTGVRHFKH
ncbi:MAG: bifunctional phosphoribosylaminoimidazolecarboxamide formyltransferase/IMP cyclohydrolase [Porphyromonas sp.]|nr:bifunctional phosphoribosylaminoimidazolecarboxamide formyltransferase/IMP cyclohydrolase [Porphyromonas sp.]